MEWTERVIDWVMDPENHDQRSEGKNEFLQTGKVEKTRLSAIGISNGALKKQAGVFYKEFKKFNFQEMVEGIDKIYTSNDILEVQILTIFLLEKFKMKFTKSLFNLINTKWIDKIDYWAISDHFCINLFGYFPLLEPNYYEEINSWRDSDNYWRRRLSISAYLKVARENAQAITHVLNNVQHLIEDENYYVRKAIPWLIRESYRKHQENKVLVCNFLETNIRYLSKTELREASKYLSEDDQLKLLEIYDRK